MIHGCNSVRTPLVAMLAMVAACSGDAPKSPSQATKAPVARTAGTQAESNGDVVIRGVTPGYHVIPVAAPGTVTGTVTLRNPIQPAVTMTTGDFGPICGAAVLDESVQATGTALGGVVVWIEGIHAGKSAAEERRLELESVQCKLRPRVQAAVVGSSVNIIGHDQFRQHLRFSAGGETTPRATVLVGGGEQVIPTDLPFKAPGLLLVRDPDHAWTRAYLAVFDHPYFAVTVANGYFSIDGVPPGKYTLHTWHERGGEGRQPIDVGPNGAVKLTLTVNVK